VEEFLNALTGGAIWGVGFGVALGLTRAATGGLRPFAKEAIKGVVSAGDWVRGTVEEGRESLEDLYHEAKAEHEASEAAEAPR
jgi:hypothetical protein